MTTVSIHMPEQSGQTGHSLYLRKTSDGTLINAGGDALTESPASSGRFTCDVAESWSETLAAAVLKSSLIVRDGWLPSGSTLVQDSYPDSAAGGSTDWTANERTAIRAILGVPSSGTTPTDPTIGIMDTIRDGITAVSAALSGTPPTAISPVADGGAITLYCDADYRVRSDTELVITCADPAGGLLSTLTAIGVAQLRFGASRAGQVSGLITGTIASLSSSGTGASQQLLVAVEIVAAGTGLRPSDDWTWQIWSRRTQGSEVDDYPHLEGTLDLRMRATSL